MADHDSVDQSFLPTALTDRARAMSTSAFDDITSSRSLYQPAFARPFGAAPDYIPDTFQPERSDHFAPRPYYQPQPQSRSHHYTSHSPPMSRSGSAGGEASAGLSHHWRSYTKSLRDQFHGEKAHLLADRARADELMAEERDINSQELALKDVQIARLTEQLARAQIRITLYEQRFGRLSNSDLKLPRSGVASPILSPPGISFLNNPRAVSTNPRTTVTAHGSADEGCVSPHQVAPILQESGRQSDGSKCWHPQPNLAAARTFEHNDAVDSTLNDFVSDDGFRVPSKEFSPQDFQRLTPDEQSARNEEARISEDAVASAVAISVPGDHISPNLEGVHLKPAAVFEAHIRSPSPVSTPLQTPPRPVACIPTLDGTNVSSSPSTLNDITNVSDAHRTSRHGSSEERVSSGDALRLPEHERLRVNAGHTPVHSRSVSKVEADLLASEATTPVSGDVTPTRTRHENSMDLAYKQVHRRSPPLQVDGPIPEEAIVDGSSGSHDSKDNSTSPCASPTSDQQPLNSPLMMGSRSRHGIDFLPALTEKLEKLQAEQESLELDENENKDEDELAPLKFDSHAQIRRSTDTKAKSPPSGPNREGEEATPASTIASPLEDDDLDDVKPLKLKASLNFGAVLGQGPATKWF